MVIYVGGSRMTRLTSLSLRWLTAMQLRVTSGNNTENKKADKQSVHTQTPPQEIKNFCINTGSPCIEERLEPGCRHEIGQCDVWIQQARLKIQTIQFHPAKKSTAQNKPAVQIIQQRKNKSKFHSIIYHEHEKQWSQRKTGVIPEQSYCTSGLLQVRAWRK